MITEKFLIEGACHFYLNDTDKAEESLEIALGLATHHSDSRLRSRVLTMMGLIAQGRGFMGKAGDYFARARCLCHTSADYYGEAAAGLNMGIVMYRRGKFDMAEKNISRAKAIFENIEWNLGMCRCLLALGNVRKYRRRFTQAIRLYRKAEKIAFEYRFARERSLAYEFTGEVHYERGSLETAESFYNKCLDIAGAIAPEGDVVVEVDRRMGELYIAQGRVQDAIACLKEGLSLSRRLKERLEEGLILRTMGMAYLSLGEKGQGKRYFKDAIGILKPTGCNFELAKTHILYAETLLDELDALREQVVDEQGYIIDLENEAWSSLIEAGYLFGEVDVPFWKKRTDDLIEKIAAKRRGFFHVRQQLHGDKHIIKVKYSSEFMIYDQFAAISHDMLKLWKQVQFAASYSRPVLITGETGTGKELVARMIHAVGDRAKRPFLAINCAAVPDHLFESEFFGHLKGCFTGAMNDRRGIFEEANGGTLFLDEIGELTPLQQVKLLRVLQENRIKRIGENIDRPINVRIISATNQNLCEKLENSTLREDFYYRINAEQIHVPPLRERSEDIIPLVTYYLRGNDVGGSEEIRIEAFALKCLQGYSWPGNVRELFAVLERVKHMGNGGVITVEMLPERIRNDIDSSCMATATYSESAEPDQKKTRLTKALTFCNGNKSAAARWLGISRCTLYKELRRTGLEHFIRERFAS
ncbi:MAG: sigma 54-interacting transcriptional regulator [Candidatus Krumholzibacteria bacterium]|nr:sigma 54-interacting transcriptional regulator [Candidatus Krumholzibacteria bacterium]